MLSENKKYTLIGKEQRSYRKVTTQQKAGAKFQDIEEFQDTICYFIYNSNDIYGFGTLVLYADNKIIPCDCLILGETYEVIFRNSYIQLINLVDEKEYNRINYMDSLNS